MSYASKNKRLTSTGVNMIKNRLEKGGDIKMLMDEFRSQMGIDNESKVSAELTCHYSGNKFVTFIIDGARYVYKFTPGILLRTLE